MAQQPVTGEPGICTIGPSTHPRDVSIDLLKSNVVAHVLDVPTVPCSRHNRQFHAGAPPPSMWIANIQCTHLPGLAGLRYPRRDSLNGGSHHVSFRGYADYMQRQEFAANVSKGTRLAAEKRCALMCMESMPRRCQRLRIANALTVRGMHVGDNIGRKGRKLHALTPLAQSDGLALT